MMWGLAHIVYKLIRFYPFLYKIVLINSRLEIKIYYNILKIKLNLFQMVNQHSQYKTKYCKYKKPNDA